jgi:ribonuclease BN (tRNA processing enzyme)
VVESEGRRLLLDCGPGVLGRLREAEPWPGIEAIAITHFHLDHWGDVVPWAWGQTLGPGLEMGKPKPELWIPPGGSELLAAISTRVGQPDMFSAAYEVHEYEDGEPFETAGFRVTPERVLHYSMLAFGFRASANGTVVGYSGDSGPSASLSEIARDADLFVCEATLLAPNPEGGTRGHLSAVEALEASEAGGAKRLLLTHRPSERPLENGFELARDGLEITI